jgi:ankyrin repeat protein
LKTDALLRVFYLWRSSVYSFYACSFLIQHKIDIHQEDGCALKSASLYGHRDTVYLLLQSRADVHTKNHYALQWSSQLGHKEIICLLLEYKADIHANDDCALRSASEGGRTDVVALLLKHKADVHAQDTKPMFMQIIIVLFNWQVNMVIETLYLYFLNTKQMFNGECEGTSTPKITLFYKLAELIHVYVVKNVSV